MVLQAVYQLSTYILPPRYYPHAFVTGAALFVTYAFTQGRTTTRERDLHARTILITGAFTPLGLTLVSALASRGAHIIALSQYPLSHPQPSLLIPLLRSTTNNPNIFAEYADLSSSESIRAFCTRFLTGEDQRLDAILFAHEYHGIGSLFGPKGSALVRRESAALATFLIITLLLPVLLVAPVERDIRIINVINPFYAAALPTFVTGLSTAFASPGSVSSPESLFVSEGHRALRAVILARHLQRVLDALPNRAPTPDSSNKESSAPAPAKNAQPSNIVSVSVAPGLSRVDTVAPLLRADRDAGPDGSSFFGFFIYFIFYPLLWLLAKTPTAALQSILHVLFLPTPFKRALAQVSAAVDPASTTAEQSSSSSKDAWEDMMPEEVLKPGALYRECSVVTLNVPSLPPSFGQGDKGKDLPSENKKDDKSQTKKSQPKDSKPKAADEFVVLEDDGEFGGEAVGRTVWEWYEMKLREWETREKASAKGGKQEEQGVKFSPTPEPLKPERQVK